MGRRRRLQLHAEGARRAVGTRAGDVHGGGNRQTEGDSRQPVVLSRRSAFCTTTGSIASTTTRSARRSSTHCRKRSPSWKKKDSSARWERHRDSHEALVEALAGIGLELLPPPAERLWSLNAVKVPDGVDEARVRKALLADHGIEIGAGLGPLAGRIWRVGLMGSGSTRENVSRLVSALAGLVRR